MSDLKSIFNSQKNYFSSKLRISPINLRYKKLVLLKKWIKKNEKFICEEIKKDFNKKREEVLLTEIKPVLDEINFALSNLRDWVEPKKVPTPLVFLGTKSKIYYEPKGVTLIIAPWNYPFNLCVCPLVSAIAAGNTVLLKPSEHTPHSAKMIQKMCADLFEEKEVAVALGDYLVSKELLTFPFDHIFFTGSPEIGKKVMKAAAENLTSVTLELGGRNPVIIDETAAIKDAAEKIVWGKFINAGQTCLAPNFIYVHKSKQKHLEEELIKQIQLQFPLTDKNSTQIVNSSHFERLKKALNLVKEEGGNILLGGELEENTNWFSPTLINQIGINSSLFKEEIFGPILPIFSYENKEEIIETLNKIEKPLALYIFTRKRKNYTYFIANSSAGTTAINETTIQYTQTHLPFGGVNHSGIGKAHGKFGYLEFSNQRSVLKQRIGFTLIKLIFPPYTKFKSKLIKFLTFRI